MKLSKNDMVEFVNKCQRMLCAYDIYSSGEGAETYYKRSAPSHCDCKYGANSSSIGRGSENGNGCPEMRCVKSILEVMTDKEFERIVKRMNKKSHSSKGIKAPFFE